MYYSFPIKIENLKVIFKVKFKKRGRDNYTAEVRVFLPAKKLSEDDPHGVFFGIYHLDPRIARSSRKIAGEMLGSDWGEHYYDDANHAHYRVGIAKFQSITLGSLELQIEAFVLDTEHTIKAIARTEEMYDDPAAPPPQTHIRSFNFYPEDRI